MSPEELVRKLREVAEIIEGWDDPPYGYVNLLHWAADWIEAHAKGGDALCVAQDAARSPRPDTSVSSTRSSDAGPSSPAGGGPSAAEFILAYIGPRCPDYEEDCFVCESWRFLDEEMEINSAD